MMAENPKVITRSLKKGTGLTVFESPVTGFPASTLLKIINSKNALLQISVNLEKKEMTFIVNVLEYAPQNNSNLAGYFLNLDGRNYFTVNYGAMMNKKMFLPIEEKYPAK
jgi:hypothetical protein